MHRKKYPDCPLHSDSGTTTRCSQRRKTWLVILSNAAGCSRDFQAFPRSADHLPIWISFGQVILHLNSKAAARMLLFLSFHQMSLSRYCCRTWPKSIPENRKILLNAAPSLHHRLPRRDTPTRNSTTTPRILSLRTNWRTCISNLLRENMAAPYTQSAHVLCWHHDRQLVP